MKRSLILDTATRYLLPLLLVFSVFVLLRGHNDPGGGFVGGLVAGSAFSLMALAGGVNEAKKALRLEPRLFIVGGLTIAILSGVFPVLVNYLDNPTLTKICEFHLPEEYQHLDFKIDTFGFMHGCWPADLPVIGAPGTPFVFDVGVYFVVIGVVLTIIFSLFEAEDEA